MMLKLLEKRARTIVFFEIVGILLCLMAANINGLIQNVSTYTQAMLTITITPIVEEVLKAIPLMIFIFAFSDDKMQATSVGLAIGTGFAILENTYILLNSNSVDFLWALGRGFGSGLMHGLAPALIGFGICVLKKYKGVLVAGIFSALTLASIFHGTYNVLVQSKLRYIGFVLPLIVYIPLIIYTVVYQNRLKRAATAAANAAEADSETTEAKIETAGTASIEIEAEADGDDTAPEEIESEPETADATTEEIDVEAETAGDIEAAKVVDNKSNDVETEAVRTNFVDLELINAVADKSKSDNAPEQTD